MRHFRLTFTHDHTILERRLNNGKYQVVELYPDRVDRDAKLLDDLLTDLSGQPTASIPAFDVK